MRDRRLIGPLYDAGFELGRMAERTALLARLDAPGTREAVARTICWNDQRARPCSCYGKCQADTGTVVSGYYAEITAAALATLRRVLEQSEGPSVQSDGGER